MSTHKAVGSVVACIALVAACCTEGPAGPVARPYSATSASFMSLKTSTAPLVLHLVAPQTTDQAIDQFLDNHYAWLDTSAQSNHKLFVFMPGASQRPNLFKLVQQEAARLGYHVIGLMYPNGVRIGAICPNTVDPVGCYEATRLETIDGVDRGPLIDVSPANSIDNRLTKLLEYLAAQYPDEGWSQFLVDGAPKWPLIAVGGHSLGGNTAAMIAKIRLVARVVLFSAVNDTLNAADGGATASPAWVVGHVTPVDRYYGIAHDDDPTGFAAIRASWESIGLAAFGPAVAPEVSDPPYGWSHMLVTDLPPQAGTNPHGAPSNDLNTPLAPDGTPLLRDAWDYLLTGLPRRPGIGGGINALDQR